MRKLIFVSLAVALFVSVTAFAQDTAKPADTKPDTTTCRPRAAAARRRRDDCDRMPAER